MQSNAKYSVGNKVIYSTDVLKSNLCDYILVRGDISIIGHNAATQVAFKKCASFIKCIPKIDGTTKDYAEALYLVMPINNLLEYNSNYSDTTGTFRFYSKDDATNFKLILLMETLFHLSAIRLNY